jgi:predicted RNase H-like nuclease (RuvC/YqgF family)
MAPGNLEDAMKTTEATRRHGDAATRREHIFALVLFGIGIGSGVSAILQHGRTEAMLSSVARVRAADARLKADDDELQRQCKVLEAANEELRAANEELQAADDRLKAAVKAACGGTR